MKKKPNKILQVLNDRLFLVFIGISALFVVIIGKFYQLQVIDHDLYANQLRASVEQLIEIPAPRGLVFDRYGRPLAVNQPTNVLKFDQQVRLKGDELNQVLLDVANTLEQNGDEYVDNVPITKNPPFEYTQSKSAINQFMYTIPYDDEKHRQALLLMSAQEVIDYLRSDDVFAIAETISDQDAREIIALRTEIYGYAYRKYNLVTIATDISDQTVAQLEENHVKYPGMIVDVEPIRYYPEGESMGSILGYTRAITEAQYEEMKALGYDKNDIVGHDGIEKTMESELRGKEGKERVEVDNMGRRVHTIEKDDAIPGNNIFLTIDLDLQLAAYNSVERRLSEAIIERLKGNNSRINTVSSREVIVSMIESSQLDLRLMEKAPEGSMQKTLYVRLMQEYNALDNMVKQTLAPLDLLIQMLEEGNPLFTEKEILLAMNEQGRMSLSDATIKSFKENKTGTTESVLIEQLEQGKLKPNQFAIDPFSASAVVMDVNTGEVLAMVGYPYADSNEMTMNFNQYYNTLFDERSMLWNRSLMTAKAPGSTYKMISGITGLEEGVITPETTIYDTGIYEKVGEPAPRCWIHSRTGGGHGSTDIIKAFEVSCNYYFYETAYRLGLQSSVPYAGIDAFTKYAEMFGLGEKTGIELAETNPNISSPHNLVKNQLTTVLYSVKNMDQERKDKYVTDTNQILEKGIYPFGSSIATDVNGQIDYLIQYELKRNLEPLLQDAFIAEGDRIVGKAYEQVQKELQTTINVVIEEIVTGSLSDASSRSLKSKTKDQLVNQLNDIIGQSLDADIKEIVEEIDIYDILDSYEYAYNLVYNREIKKNPDSEIVAELRSRLEALESQEEYYVSYVTAKVRENLVNAIATELLDGLELEWTDGFTVRTAIGQGSNAFTPLQMTRYIAALANGHTVYNARIISGMFDVKDDNAYEPKPSTVFNQLDVSESTMDIIHQGMYQVTNGSQGSARHEFKDFNVKVAAKTGTAQEGTKHEHSWFVGFAPYDEPQIAFVTTVYNSDGLDTYGKLIAKDVLTEYFKLEEEPTKTTLDHTFAE